MKIAQYILLSIVFLCMSPVDAGASPDEWIVPWDESISLVGTTYTNHATYMGSESEKFALDFSLDGGCEIFAPCSGRMERYKSWDSAISTNGMANYGNYVMFTPDDIDEYVIMAHFQSLSDNLVARFESGDPSIKRGELIGYMGSTGNSSETHLHFEITVPKSQVQSVFGIDVATLMTDGAQGGIRLNGNAISPIAETSVEEGIPLSAATADAYIMRDDLLHSVPALLNHGHDQNAVVGGILYGGFVYQDGLDIPQVSRYEGDKLITLRDIRNCMIYQIADVTENCVPIRFLEYPNRLCFARSFSSVDHWQWEEKTSIFNQLELSEINGVAASESEKMRYLNNDDCYLEGEKNEAITLGYYVGMDWYEETAVCDHTLVFFGQADELTVNKTKYGYCDIDVSTVDPGIYVLLLDVPSIFVPNTYYSELSYIVVEIV